MEKALERTCSDSRDHLDITDINLATCLALNGHPLEDSYIGERNRVVFSFEHTHDADDLITRFMKGDLLVDPGDFLKVYRYLKGRIFELRDEAV